MNIELVIFSTIFIILGVVFTYPLFYTKNKVVVDKPIYSPDSRATFQADLKKITKLLILLIAPILLHVVMGSSKSIEFSKETYSFLAALATILLMLII